MEKINVAELLRNCPRGMELDCTMFDDVKFIAVDEAEKPICIRTGVAYRFLTKFGTWTFDENAKCVIFPKGKTSWEGFVPPCQFKVGDRIKHKDSGIYCTLGEYSEGISAYRTNIGLAITYKDLEQWELVPNKFDITTLKPFESRVLVRDNKSQMWSPAIWGFYDSDSKDYQYKLVGVIARYCIPYEGNEHLLGKTDDCDEFYKIS